MPATGATVATAPSPSTTATTTATRTTTRRTTPRAATVSIIPGRTAIPATMRGRAPTGRTMPRPGGTPRTIRRRVPTTGTVRRGTAVGIPWADGAASPTTYGAGTRFTVSTAAGGAREPPAAAGPTATAAAASVVAAGAAVASADSVVADSVVGVEQPGDLHAHFHDGLTTAPAQRPDCHRFDRDARSGWLRRPYARDVGGRATVQVTESGGGRSTGRMPRERRGASPCHLRRAVEVDHQHRGPGGGSRAVSEAPRFGQAVDPARSQGAGHAP